VSLAAAAALLAGLPLSAQMHKVEAPEKVTRAIGVYEWTGELDKPTAARLVPVSLFINGHFEDAGAYLAQPIPWVLDSGNVYFIEKAGQQEGTLDLELARNSVDARSNADDNPLGAWYGYGRFQLPSAAPRPKPLPTSRVNPTIEGSDDDSRPHMSRRTPPAVKDSGSTGSSKTPGAGSTPADDSDRPTMQRRSGSSTTSSDTTTTAANDDYDPDRPTLRHREDDNGKKPKRQKAQASVSGPETSLNDDPDRPHLRHGSPKTDPEAGALTGLPAEMHQAIAVSDPANRPAHTFTRSWESASERSETLTALESQARTRIAAYLTANKLTPGSAPVSSPAGATSASPVHSSAAPVSSTEDGAPPVLRTKASADAAKAAAAKTAAAKTPAPKTAATPSTATKPSTPATPAARAAAARRAARTRAAKPPALALMNEQVSGFELSYGGLPTFLYTADAPTAQGAIVHLTLVAQKLPSGQYQVALASVTDDQHLNRVPWMRPVDVVDPDDEHRASLLMELRAQSSRQFALYRVTGPQAEQIFVTGVIE
jgi:hypothetical protein